MDVNEPGRMLRETAQLEAYRGALRDGSERNSKQTKSDQFYQDLIRKWRPVQMA
jgi:hypothetical protein